MDHLGKRDWHLWGGGEKKEKKDHVASEPVGVCATLSSPNRPGQLCGASPTFTVSV